MNVFIPYFYNYVLRILIGSHQFVYVILGASLSESFKVPVTGALALLVCSFDGG